MSKLPSLAALLWLWGGASACEPVPAPKTAPVQVVSGVMGAKVVLDGLVWKPGLAEYEIQVTGQGKRSVEVWMPDAPAADALVIFLHGAITQHEEPRLQGRAAEEQTRALVACLAAPALGALNPLIIAPRSPLGRWWDRLDTEFVLGLVLAARERWPAAATHGVISGYSNGGIGAWFFARLYPEYFSAAIPMAFSDEIVGESKLPIYGIAGTKDELFDFERVRAAMLAQRAQGRNVTLKEKYRGTHLEACSYVPELESAARWLQTHVFEQHEPQRQ